MPEAPPAEDAVRIAPVRRVRKAYEQVYDQLRELIMHGELARGERLPNEIVLAREFGVSRGTVREALRSLAAHNLIRTVQGPSGDSFVTLPTVDHISSFLQANIGLLSESDDVTLPEFLETRELLEVFAARLCARRRSGADLERLRGTIPDEPARLNAQQRFSTTRSSTRPCSTAAATRCCESRRSRSSPCCRPTSPVRPRRRASPNGSTTITGRS